MITKFVDDLRKVFEEKTVGISNTMLKFFLDKMELSTKKIVLMVYNIFDKSIDNFYYQQRSQNFLYFSSEKSGNL